MSAIVRADAVDFAGELPQIFQLATALKGAGGFLPPHIRSEGELVAIILAGRELGINPMAALRSINLIKGRVTLAADMQLALMMRAGAQVKWTEDGRSGSAVLSIKRPGQDWHVQTFTMEDAKQAGLAGGENWRKYPAAMLRARAVSAAAKAIFPDVLSGVYLPDEIEEVAGATPAAASTVGGHRKPQGDRGEGPAARPARAGDQPEEQPTFTVTVVDEPPAQKKDEYGLAIPYGECPVVRKGKPNAGKTWAELPGGLLEKMYADFGDKMSDHDRLWAEYLLAKRQARKAREAAQAAMQDATSEGGGFLDGEVEPANVQAAEGEAAHG